MGPGIPTWTSSSRHTQNPPRESASPAGLPGTWYPGWEATKAPALGFRSAPALPGSHTSDEFKVRKKPQIFQCFMKKAENAERPAVLPLVSHPGDIF